MTQSPRHRKCTPVLWRGLCGMPLALRLSEGLGFCAAATVLPCVSDPTEVHSMRTNIEIDDKLMKDALRATGAKTKKEAVELGLRTLLDLRAQVKARELRGKITWEGDLTAMRTDR
jgi:Arc/MetJ family transcription regulator